MKKSITQPPPPILEIHGRFMKDPISWTWSARIRSNTALFMLNLVPLLLLRFKLYIIALIVICMIYFIHHFFSLSRYNLAHVPRLRINLYLEWPICYLIVFIATLHSDGWGTFAILIAIAYQVAIYSRLAKLIMKSYLPHNTGNGG